MADQPQTLNIPSLLFVIVIIGLSIRYFFFSSSSPSTRRPYSSPPRIRFNPSQVEQIENMFPQIGRREIMWELQRNGGSVAAATERILGGNLETVSFPFLKEDGGGGREGGGYCFVLRCQILSTYWDVKGGKEKHEKAECMRRNSQSQVVRVYSNPLLSRFSTIQFCKMKTLIAFSLPLPSNRSSLHPPRLKPKLKSRPIQTS